MITEGAAGYHAGRVVFQPGFKVNKVVETVGAGDTFLAGIILGHVLQTTPKSRQGSFDAGIVDMERVLSMACRLAADKCSQV